MTRDEIDSLLADFRDWLTRADAEFDDEADFEVTLVEQFTALRHEVNLLTRALRSQNPPDAPKEDDRRPFILAVLEAADAWDRAAEALQRLAASQEPRGWARWFHRGDERPKITAAAEGLTLGRQRFAAAMQKLGLARVETVGQTFNPETMEALEAVAAASAAGTVVEEVRAGYRWQGKVIRFAQVRVAK